MKSIWATQEKNEYLLFPCLQPSVSYLSLKLNLKSIVNTFSLEFSTLFYYLSSFLKNLKFNLSNIVFT